MGFLKKGVSVIPLDEFPITKLQLGKRLNNLLNPSDLIKVKLLLFFSSFFKIFFIRSLSFSCPGYVAMICISNSLNEESTFLNCFIVETFFLK